jgi:uncharacterized repeat protein (TIGR04138 family)
MTQTATEVDWRRLAAKAGPYPPEAYHFVRDGLGRTMELVHGQPGAPEGDRHVSGQQLCMGLREYAIERYGMMACSVLLSWHVERTDDFGRIVFAMIDAGLLSKTSRDSLEDFRGVFDFHEAFSRDRLVTAIGRRTGA